MQDIMLFVPVYEIQVLILSLGNMSHVEIFNVHELFMFDESILKFKNWPTSKRSHIVNFKRKRFFIYTRQNNLEDLPKPSSM